MPDIIWLPEALADIDRLHSFLKKKNKQAAARPMRAICDGATLLIANPKLGRPMPDETGRREFSVAFASGAYILRYKLNKDCSVIVRVWHSREDRAST